MNYDIEYIIIITHNENKLLLYNKPIYAYNGSVELETRK